ncbi:MAG: hypothetical protein M3378_08210 [Actinomycetota bacterium]|nr:hypothetical protein [Actinomycetota bacterium]
MGLRAAEHVLRARPGAELRLRVDLHGVSTFGPGEERTLVRWEWVEHILGDDHVDVVSAKARVHLPAGAFGLPPERLRTLLEEARSPEKRADVITELSGRRTTAL